MKNKMEERRQMDIRMAKIETNIEYIKETLYENKQEHKELLVIFEKAMQNKAGKWVEKVLIYLAVTIVSVAIPLMIYQILHI